MSYNVVINGNNVVNSIKNTYRYDFINGTFEIGDGSEIMITNFQIPYSWFNITSKNNNNTFKFYWPTGSNTYNTFTIIIPDGFYTTTTFIYSAILCNKWYVFNRSGYRYVSLFYKYVI